MSNTLFKEYKTHSLVESNIIEKYQYKLPEELIYIWRKYGFGSMLNGNLKIINPEEYESSINQSYFRANIAIPIMITGLGDIITWEKNEYVGIIKLKNQDFDIILRNFKNFFKCLEDNYFLKNYLNINEYNKAINKYGQLEFDECFGYIPLLVLGGSEKVENLKKVKIKEYILLITQLVGKIE